MTLLQPAQSPSVARGNLDPSRSSSLRRRGRGLVNTRVFSLVKRLRVLLQEYDVPGLGLGVNAPSNYQPWFEKPSARLARTEVMLRKVVEEEVAHPPDWLSALVTAAVGRGVARAGKELAMAHGGLDIREVSHMLSASVTLELQGISAETQRRVLRSVVKAMVMMRTPQDLMREVRVTLERVTRNRLIALVNTETVRAVNAGKLLAYKAGGVKLVGVEPEYIPASLRRTHKDHHFRDAANPYAQSPRTQERRERAERILEEVAGSGVEVLTAGDDLVCEECEDIASGGPYTLDEARGLIPAHPNCRCSFVPVEDQRYAAAEHEEHEERERE